MASLRRSTRKCATAKAKIKAVCHSDREEDIEPVDSDACSDFELELKKKKSNAPASSSSSSESEMEEKPVTNRKVAFVKKSPAPVPNTLPGKPAKFQTLNLSSSDDDDDDDDGDKAAVAPQHLKAVGPATQSSTSSGWMAPAVKREAEENMDDAIASQLESLARSYDQTFVKPEADRHSEQNKSPLKKDKLEDDISHILSMGEQKSLFQPVGSDDEMEPCHLAEDAAKLDAKGAMTCIEVPIQVPSHVAVKKKNAFDPEAHLVRQLAKARRQIQEWMHKTHILCLVAHLRHLNRYTTAHSCGHASAVTSLAVALSVIPLVHVTKAQKMDAVVLAAFTHWFREVFPVVRSSEKAPLRRFPRPIGPWLQKALENFCCQSFEQLVLIYVLMTRALGWSSRIVLNLNTVPLKPTSNDMEDLSKSKKASCSNKKTSDKTDKKSPDKMCSERTKRDKKRSTTTCRKSDTAKMPEVCKKRKSDDLDVQDGPSKPTKKAKQNSKKSQVDSDPSKDQSLTTLRPKCKSSSTEEDRPLRASRRNKPATTTKDTKKETKNRDDSSHERPSRSASRGRHGAKSDSTVKCSSSTSGKRVTAPDSSKGSFVCSNQRSTRGQAAAAGTDTKATSPLKKRRSAAADLSKDALKEARKRSVASSRRSNGLSARKKMPDSDEDEDYSSDEFEQSQKKRISISRPNATKKGKPSQAVNYWVEVWVPKTGWICVDVIRGTMNEPNDMAQHCSQPALYIVACNPDGSLKDLTKKYVNPSTFLSTTRKMRISEDWLQEGVLVPFAGAISDMDKAEDEKIKQRLMSADLPSTVSAFKDHPLFALARHLLKFEAIYPPNAPTLGYLKKEPVFARECVHTLRCRVTWLKEGRVVRVGQEPYKIVKARPKWDRIRGDMIKDQPLELFGHWQTDLYEAPEAKDGIVPRNEFGNVDLFKPWMLPKGTVHLPINGLIRVANKLHIDCAPAMVGWEFSGYTSRPVFDGYIVCQQFSEKLMDAWHKDQEDKAKRDQIKKEKRVLDNWTKLTRGLLIYRKIRNKYLKTSA